MRINKLYLDMDGVLCDFNKRYTEIFNVSPEITRDNKSFNGYFDKFIEDKQFATLDWIPGAIDALSYISKLPVQVEILSSTARDEFYDQISKQKIIWLKNRGIDFPSTFVPGKKHKYKFATPDSIIIDDTKSVITDWEKAGGIAIHHTDWNTTISKLTELLTTPK